MKNLLSFFRLLLLLSVFTSQANTTKPDTIPSEKEYIKEIPFTFDYGIPIIKVTFKKKEYPKAEQPQQTKNEKTRGNSNNIILTTSVPATRPLACVDEISFGHAA